MPGEPVCRRERRAGESVVDSGYMEAGGMGCGQPAGGSVLQVPVNQRSGPLERKDSQPLATDLFCFSNNLICVSKKQNKLPHTHLYDL